MEQASVIADTLKTPFVSSFIGASRAGDLFDTDPKRRRSAWAHWSITNLTNMTGKGDREYKAIALPGRFYDPKGKMGHLHPHLEISKSVLETPDSSFPDRLAQLGNGAIFPWWVMTEVTALRRALFNHAKGDIDEFIELLNDRRVSLVDSLNKASEVTMSSWAIIEDKLFSEEDNLSDDAAGDIKTEEIAQLFPLATEMKLEVIYDERLRESNQKWASRRVGVWQIVGYNSSDEKFSLGVVTPRLTANSLFKDPIFKPSTESAAAILVRTLLLRRLVKNHIGKTVTGEVVASATTKTPGGPYLRAIVAKMGAKMPQASIPSAVHFLRSYPDAETAWQVLTRWAGSSYLLTVSKEGFLASHKNASRFVRRSEEPLRDDIDVILPLAWDQTGNARVVRVTFSKASSEEVN